MKCRMLASHSCDKGTASTARMTSSGSSKCGGAGGFYALCSCVAAPSYPASPAPSVTSNVLYCKHVTFS